MVERASLWIDRFGIVEATGDNSSVGSRVSGRQIRLLRIEDFESAEAPEEIPLDDISGRFAGQFSCLFETLIWSPPSGTASSCWEETAAEDCRPLGWRLAS
jgi:hypothetical protein